MSSGAFQAGVNKRLLSLEEALGLISDIARHGEGADRLRALKEIRMMAQETGSVTLPEPMTDGEVVDRLARLIRAAGPTASQMAYKKAFPHSNKAIQHAAPRVLVGDLNIDKNQLPISLKQLYKMFPEIKRPGVPPGYPRGKGLAEIKKWCQEQALRILMQREQNKMNAATENPAEEQGEPEI